MKIYEVGGCVRDELLGVKSKDIDYAVEAGSYQEMLDWVKAHGKVFLETPQHLTVRAHIKGMQPADFVLCRKDGAYSDGRHPDTVEPGTIMDDLARRDFTVNAIAKCEDGTYLDPFHGRADLELRLLRCVGNSHERFMEDALRVLRAMRFHITRGFEIEEGTERCMVADDVVALLQRSISADRKRDELTKCFAYDTLGTLRFLERMGTPFKRAVFHGDRGHVWLLPTSKEV